MAYERQYSEVMLDSMQSAYGAGFLSPGAGEEVVAILDGLSLAGRDVLDFGCGVGGAAMLMARGLDAGSVLCVDVEAHTLGRAAAAVDAVGLAGRIGLKLVEPGPLPVPDQSIDVIFTNDVICHLADKQALFADLMRVLRPGGVFAGGDWMTGENGPGRAIRDDWVAQLHAGGLRFRFESIGVYRDALAGAGFTGIEARDNSAWAERIARAQLDDALGPAREPGIASLGRQVYERRLDITRTRVEALASGGVHHWLIQARRPG
jgi:phosphoethanolamine N-methyltransferase